LFRVLNCIITKLGSELTLDSAYCFMQLFWFSKFK